MKGKQVRKLSQPIWPPINNAMIDHCFLPGFSSIRLLLVPPPTLKKKKNINNKLNFNVNLWLIIYWTMALKQQIGFQTKISKEISLSICFLFLVHEKSIRRLIQSIGSLGLLCNYSLFVKTYLFSRHTHTQPHTNTHTNWERERVWINN